MSGERSKCGELADGSIPRALDSLESADDGVQ